MAGDEALDPGGGADGGVTAVIRRRVRPDRRDAYEAWLAALVDDARQLGGVVGVEVQRPRPDDPDPTYTSIVRFAGVDDLRRFEASDLRARHLAAVDDLVRADATWDTHDGFALWLDAPAGIVAPQPVRWRMAVLIGTVVYLLVLVFGAVAGVVLAGLPFALRLAIVIALEIALMTYVLLPWLTRRLARWLFAATT